MSRPTLVDNRVQTICLFALTLIAVAVALYWLRPVLIPFVLAIFFAYMMVPLVDLLNSKARVPRPLATLVALVVGGAALVGVGALIANSVRQLGRNADLYQKRFAELVEASAAFAEQQGWEQGGEAVQRYLAGLPIGDMLALTANTLLDTVTNAFLVLIFAIYLLFGYRPAPGGPGALRTRIEQRVKRFIATKLAVSAATGTTVGLILTVLGVDLALVFGVLAFLLNFIPSVGSIIATLLPLPLLLVSPEATTTTIVLALVLPGSVQILVGNVIEPKIMGDSLELHPITVLLALILWGVIWGIPGMFLATPITAVLKILFETLDLTRPLARLMAGRVDELWSEQQAQNEPPPSQEPAPAASVK